LSKAPAHDGTGVEVIRCSHDARGLVFEPIGPELLPLQRNVHAVMTEPGETRGNHYHRFSTEIAVVLGPALVRLREKGGIREIQVRDGEAHRFTIPPGVAHAFKNIGTKPMLLVAFSTAVFDVETPDVVRDELI
jgi:dTDP-4-dehydrorhamnose 3,5-epimerase-like enzyme